MVAMPQDGFAQSESTAPVTLPPALEQALANVGTGSTDQLQETLAGLLADSPENAELYFSAVFARVPAAGLDALLNVVGAAARSGSESAGAIIRQAVRGAVSGSLTGSAGGDAESALQQIQDLVTFVAQEVAENIGADGASLVGEISRGASQGILTGSGSADRNAQLIKAAAQGTVAGVISVGSDNTQALGEMIKQATSGAVESILGPADLDVASVEALIEAVNEGTVAGVAESLGAGSEQSEELIAVADSSADESTELLDFQTASLEPDAEADGDESVSPN